MIDIRVAPTQLEGSSNRRTLVLEREKMEKEIHSGVNLYVSAAQGSRGAVEGVSVTISQRDAEVIMTSSRLAVVHSRNLVGHRLAVHSGLT